MVAAGMSNRPELTEAQYACVTAKQTKLSSPAEQRFPCLLYNQGLWETHAWSMPKLYPKDS